MRRVLIAGAAACLALLSLSASIGTAEARPPWERGGGGPPGWSQRGGPPPWAPAWGYRARQRGIHPGRAAHERRLLRRERFETRGEWRAEERGWGGRGNGRWR